VSLCWTEGAERLHAQMPNGTGCKKSSAWWSQEGASGEYGVQVVKLKLVFALGFEDYFGFGKDWITDAKSLEICFACGGVAVQPTLGADSAGTFITTYDMLRCKRLSMDIQWFLRPSKKTWKT
jgi:hypothetical protein